MSGTRGPSGGIDGLSAAMVPASGAGSDQSAPMVSDGVREAGAGPSSAAAAGPSSSTAEGTKAPPCAYDVVGRARAAETSVGAVYRSGLLPTKFGKSVVCSWTEIGRRKKQEDRMAFVPNVGGREDVSFYGVFDGTVGDDASDFVHHVAVQNMVNNAHFKAALKAADEAKRWVDPKAVSLFEAAMRLGYKESDAQLLAHAGEKRLDYTSSTSVTAFVAGDLLTVGHLGDSRIILGREHPGSGLVGRRLTVDHKPDQATELKRIQGSGGSLTYLHGGKPFIRGGDFTARQAKGDRPMQLNYSRAFGGKDLKPFGLSAEPTITQVQLTSRDKVLILGSDGVWDVMPPDDAVRLVTEARAKGANPAQQLVHRSLVMHNARGSIDNVTAIVIFL